MQHHVRVLRTTALTEAAGGRVLDIHSCRVTENANGAALLEDVQEASWRIQREYFTSLRNYISSNSNLNI